MHKERPTKNPTSQEKIPISLLEAKVEHRDATSGQAKLSEQNNTTVKSTRWSGGGESRIENNRLSNCKKEAGPPPFGEGET